MMNKLKMLSDAAYDAALAYNRASCATLDFMDEIEGPEDDRLLVLEIYRDEEDAAMEIFEQAYEELEWTAEEFGVQVSYDLYKGKIASLWVGEEGWDIG